MNFHELLLLSPCVIRYSLAIRLFAIAVQENKHPKNTLISLLKLTHLKPFSAPRIEHAIAWWHWMVEYHWSWVKYESNMEWDKYDILWRKSWSSRLPHCWFLRSKYHGKWFFLRFAIWSLKRLPCFISPQKFDRVKSHCITNSEGDTGYNFTISARFTRATLTSYVILIQITRIF